MTVNYIKLAVVYFIIAILLGLSMGIMQDFSFTSVHAHLNLLGWVTLALFGVIYHCFPQAAETSLAKIHFWLHNIGLPVMQGSLFFSILTGTDTLLPLTIIGSILIIIGAFLFLMNVFTHVK